MNKIVRLRKLRGFTLVELMVAMVLGLVVIGGALSVIASNKRSYRTTEALSQVQESARTAFELLARDIREAGATGCDNAGRVANVINPGTAWWQTGLGLRGYESAETHPNLTTGTAAGQRVAGTDSLQIRGATGAGFGLEVHEPANAIFRLSAAMAGIVANDIMIVCDFDHATLFQVTNYANRNITHAAGGSFVPGNCSTGVGFPTNCATPNAYTFQPNSLLVKFGANDWYIGNNGRADEGGRSLYRKRLVAGGQVRVEEVVAGVTDLQLAYRLNSSDTFVAADSITAANWANVNAVSITFVIDSADSRVSTDDTTNSGRLQRNFTHVVALRNRVP